MGVSVWIENNKHETASRQAGRQDPLQTRPDSDAEQSEPGCTYRRSNGYPCQHRTQSMEARTRLCWFGWMPGWLAGGIGCGCCSFSLSLFGRVCDVRKFSVRHTNLSRQEIHVHVRKLVVDSRDFALKSMGCSAHR